MLFWYIFELCLCAVKETLAGKAARTYCNKRLVYIVAYALWVFDCTEGYENAVALMVFKNILECIVYGKKESD